MFGANDCYCRTKNTLQKWTVLKTVKNCAYLAPEGLGGGYSLGGVKSSLQGALATQGPKYGKIK